MKKRADNAGIAFRSSHALQGSIPWARRSPWRKQTQYSLLKACMHRRSSRIHDKAERPPCFIPFFPHVLEIAQPDYTRRDSSVIGIIRTLSRIDRIFVNLPMAEARDFHCYSHVFENLGNQSITSDHAAVRIVIQKPSHQGQQCKRIPSWMSKHPVFCSILKRLHDDHRYSADPFSALADFKTISEKGQKADCSRTLTQDAWEQSY